MRYLNLFVIASTVILVSGCIGEGPTNGGNGNSGNGGGNGGTPQPNETIEVTRISYHLDAPEGFPTIFEWANNDLWYVFKLKKNGQTDAYFVPSSDNGKTWKTSLQTKITEGATNIEHLTMTQINDNVLMAWDDGHEIYCLVSDDQGQTWKDVNLGLDDDWYPFLFKKSETEIWLVYISKKNGEGGVIKYMSSTDGIEWSEPTVIKENPDAAGSSAVYGNAVMHEIESVLWLVWDTGAELAIMSDLLTSISVDNGETWGSTLKGTSTVGIDEVDPFICEQPNGKKMMIYASGLEGQNPEDYSDYGTGEVYDIYYRCYDGAWDPEQKFPEPINTEHLDWYPLCFATSKGTILLAFCSDRDAPALTHIGGREAYVARFPEMC